MPPVYFQEHKKSTKHFHNLAFIQSFPFLVIFSLPAVVNLHREFLDAGADILQSLTFHASEDRLCYRGNEAGKLYSVRNYK